MKLIRCRNLLLIGLILTVPLTGCRKRPGAVTPLPGAFTAIPKDNDTSGLIGANTNALDTAAKSTEIPAVDPTKYEKYDAHPEILQSQTVYFDFDSSVVKSGEKTKVASVADYLKANPANALRVDGHCDERGTEEYNRSLGERRALAIREELARSGSDPGRVLTVTLGKDRPADPGHDEAAWKKNRRGEFIVLTPPK